MSISIPGICAKRMYQGPNQVGVGRRHNYSNNIMQLITGFHGSTTQSCFFVWHNYCGCMCSLRFNDYLHCTCTCTCMYMYMYVHVFSVRFMYLAIHVVYRHCWYNIWWLVISPINSAPWSCLYCCFIMMATMYKVTVCACACTCTCTCTCTICD